MPSVSDHARRDAEHAARSDIRIVLMKYARRLDEKAKANIANAIASAPPGTEINGTQIGRDAAAAAIESLLSSEPYDAIEAPAAPAASLDA